MEKNVYANGWKRNSGYKPSKPDNRDFTFEELKKQKDKIPDDVLEREVTIKLILGCPLKELNKVRKAIRSLIEKYDIREVDNVEKFD